jgi:topoisomerase IV subunit A
MEIVEEIDSVSLETDKGHVETVLAANFRNNDRYSNGSFVLDQGDSGSVVKIWREPRPQL